MLTNIRQSPLATKREQPEENGGQLRAGATVQKGKKANVGLKAPSIHIVENEEQAQTCFREVEAEKRRLRSIGSQSSQIGATSGNH
jgi:hypothetical protein